VDSKKGETRVVMVSRQVNAMKRPLKIFYVYYDYPNVIPIHSYEVITQLARDSNKIYVFANVNKYSNLTKEWRRLNIEIINVRSLSKRFIGEITFIFHLIVKVFLCYFKHPPNLIYIRHGSPSLVGVIIGKILRIPVCLEVNDILTKRAKFRGINFLKNIWIKLYEGISFPLADRIFPVTDGITNWIYEKYKPKMGRVITIPNGVNVERFYPADLLKCRTNYKLPDSALIVGYLGSLFRWAGLEYLIDVAPSIIAVYPSVLFVIGGSEEPYYSLLMRKVNEANLSDYFKFFGRIGWNDAATFINTMDLCVVPAYFEDLQSGISPQKLFAYQACGKPVIGSDIPGLGDLLERERIGLSFPMGDQKALAKAIIDLLSNKERLKEMGERGRNFVVKNHAWEIIVDRIQTNFRELICIKRR